VKRTSAEYQWNSTVRLGRKSDSSNALYASKIVTVPLPSSSAPWGVTRQRHVNVNLDGETLTRGGKEWYHVGAFWSRERYGRLGNLQGPTCPDGLK